MDKIVFFDIDGTLLDYDKTISESTKAGIELLKRNGIFVAIATGRAPFMFETIRQELDIDSYVSLNGQYVVFENQRIYSRPLDKDVFHALANDSNRNNHPLVYLTEDCMIANRDNHPMIQESLDSLHFPYPEVDKDFYQSREIYQSLLFCEEGEERYYVKHYPMFEFIRWHPFSVDVLPKGGSKAIGIQKMIEKLGVKMEQTIAFGDGLNDVEMLKTVGTGVAMGNAHPNAKSVSQFVTKDVDEDGIFYALKELKLI